MWREHLQDLSSQHKWPLAVGALLTTAGLAWYIGAIASPTAPPYAGLHQRPAARAPSPFATTPALQVPPQTFEQVTPDQAEAQNARTPFASLPNPAARPFKLDAAPTGRARSPA